MKRLRILIIHNALLAVAPEYLPNELRWLEWPGCPLLSLPSTFHARKLVVLNLQHSFIGHFEGFKNYSCQKLEAFPDVIEKMPCLEKLCLSGTAIKVLPSSIKNISGLKVLTLAFCRNLADLPNSIYKLTLLECLLLEGCQKLEAFPDVIGKMPCLEKLCLSGTAIKVLPSSIKNISGLKVLNLAFCRNLADLPNSIYKLTHLECLLLEGCSKLDKFPVNGDNDVPSNLPTSSKCYENSSGSYFLLAQANSLEGSSLLTFPMLRWLDLQNCCLGNVNFLKMHNCFPMLKELDLSGNIFAIIPETLLLFTHLKSLRLNKCKKLQEIPALPQNIKRLEARDCELLERYSPLDREGKWPARLRVVDFSNCHKLEGKNKEDAFFSKALHQKFQVEMVLPGSKILEWFTFTSEQGSLTYHVPSSVFEKIQGLVICSILCLEDGMTPTISCELFVDGKSMILCSRDFFPLETDHMWLYYQPYCYTRALGSARNDSVRFDISFEVLGAPGGSALKMCGIYFVYKQDKTMTDPSSTQSTSYHTDHSVSFDLMTSCYKVDPEFNTSPDMNRKRPATSDLTQRCYNDELELTRLRVVDSSNCHKLAKNKGKNMEGAFFSKALHQKFQVEMFLPGSKIPEWFTSTSEQGSLTYHVPSFVLEKIQGLVICSILCLEDGTTPTISCELFVDGKSMILCSRHVVPLETDHMWLYYQPYCYTRALGSARNDLVRFDISFEVLGAPGGSALKMCGIYFVCKQDKTMTDPSSTQSTSYLVCKRDWLSLSLQPMSDPSSTQSTSYHTDHSVSFDLMTSCHKVDPEFKMSPDMNRKRQKH
ncbi:hypothetical protein OIU85_003818 [Salix viminalis]|uniref:TMV resistance protein N n=1 Tax=Salix viminalis TaxID=40686 RepID=A0A9Q0PZY4_SALVM|nr:hypothetical protein OIU85_003818 [Salix viminalis]